MVIDEDFSTASFDARLGWINPPPAWRLGPGGLTLEPAAGSDFWQATHYGFRVDNGHALLAEVMGDFELSTELSFEPVHQYDQAGLLVYLSADCWLKASIEFEGAEPSRLGSVVTNGGWSDWATSEVPATLRQARYGVSRRGGDYVVRYADESGRWQQLRVAHLHADDGARPLRAGIYACSPRGAGFRATFRRLQLEIL